MQGQAWKRLPLSVTAAYERIAIPENAERTVERLGAKYAEGLASAAQLVADEDADAFADANAGADATTYVCAEVDATNDGDDNGYNEC